MMRQECREQSYREAFTKERGNRRHDRHSLGATQWEKKPLHPNPPVPRASFQTRAPTRTLE